MYHLLRRLVPHQVLTLLITENVIIFSSFLAAASLVLKADPTVYLLYDGGLLRILIIQATMLVSLYFHDLYAEVHVKSRIQLVQRAFQISGIAFLVQAILSYVAPDLILSRWLMIIGCGLSLISLILWRLFYSAVLLRALGAEGVLFLGDNALTREIAQHMDRFPELGMRPLGYLCGLSKFQETISASHPDQIVVGHCDRQSNAPLMELIDLRLSGIRVDEAAATFERVLKRVPLTELRPNQFIFEGERGPRELTAGLLFLSSVVVAAIAFLVSAPLMVVLAIAIKLSSPGPVLCCQRRVGRLGRTFALYKFRCLTVHVEPRITPLGRWLKLSRLDELPLIINILRGDLSLVGPRPERPEFVQEFSDRIPFYRQRLCVRPGLTGWAQINYKDEGGPEDAARNLEYDLYYLKHLSLALILYILLHTLKAAR